MNKIYRPSPTPQFIRRAVGGDLYNSAGRCLAEIMRNAADACMLDVWDPKRAKIEISLVPNHPLAPKGQSALVVLDHGSGLTEVDLERYFMHLGSSEGADNGRKGSTSQKGIGRFATLALNEHWQLENQGYFLFSRTQDSGEIRFITVTPELMCREQGVQVDKFVHPSAKELGPLQNNSRGSFTAVVIPTPVFKSASEIYDSLKWFLPREQSKMFALTINGKSVQPPPLPHGSDVISEVSPDGKYRAYIGLAPDEEDAEHGGIWLCDEMTGFRVASCQARDLRRHGMPDPLWFTDLTGDIFAPGLLQHQDTARNSLEKDYTRSKEWTKLKLGFLVRTVARKAAELIEQDPISSDAAAALEGIIELLHSTWGIPPETESEYKKKKKEDDSDDSDKRGEKRKRKTYATHKRRHQRIKVRDEVYDLYLGRNLPEHVFAEVNIQNTSLIELNVRGAYKALPTGKQARAEHCLMQILHAVASTKQNLPSRASRLANEFRSELFPKKRS